MVKAENTWTEEPHHQLNLDFEKSHLLMVLRGSNRALGAPSPPDRLSVEAAAVGAHTGTGVGSTGVGG